LGVSKNSIGYKALKYIGTRTETGIGVTANLGKGLVQGSYFLGESIGTCLRPYVIEGGRSLGLFGLDDDAVYNYAINDASSRINNVKKQWSAVPGAMASSFFTTFNAKNAYNFLFNPDLSLHDSFTYGESATNTFFTMYATKNLATAAGNKVTSYMDGIGSQLVTAEGIVVNSGSAVGSAAVNLPMNSMLASSMNNINRGGSEKQIEKSVKTELHRPYIRKAVRKKVESRAPKTADGKFIDPNTGLPIEGDYHLGHKPGHEFWREKAKAEVEGLTQKQFNDRMNNPDYYQIEDPLSNMSHKYELKK